MDFKQGFMYNLNVLQSEVQVNSNVNYENSLLEWAATQSPLSLSVYEKKAQIQEKSFYRYSIQGETTSGEKFSGFGRSQNQTTAATIAAMEALERLVCKRVLKDTQLQSLRPSFEVHISEGNISFTEPINNEYSGWPTEGFHSSNGWALHFNARSAAMSATREALERHILLANYIENGWDSFSFNESAQYEDHISTPAIAHHTYGGFAAGIVITSGKESKGSTFGYLCDKQENFNSTHRWANAFYESFEQWEDLTNGQKSITPTKIESIQCHYFENEAPKLKTPQSWFPKSQLEIVQTNLLVIDLQRVFLTPFPLYAAFAFGGDILPLAIKSKLTPKELECFESILKRLGIYKPLPEVHPIL